MPIEYSVTHGGKRIYTYPKGALDMRETINYFSRLTKDPDVKHGAVEIVDFRHVTDFKISYLEGDRITKSYQAPKSAQKIDRTIFVCESEIAYGIGRMLQTLHEITNPAHTVIVARSESELEKLLEKK